ncbi:MULTISPECIES: hypothetical protein [Serratia]|uniref:Uncharacterized protein n=3 Tax=Serratia TaxID=613 RepID=A0AAP7F7J2_SERFO|nr:MULTISPECIES: hypothetical protein [Serratia]MBC3213322.1 hypothetical protein [Serratia fonticola]MBP0997867.1 hypothetical protein [Serratia fonticola]MBP1005161.1 hypothetical protein [Serratia fonticola]MBP1013877.1 hypothetical protein [Serratia fonticola]MBP1016791.1 hypothetical protein [Serratia fonticola]
MTDKLSIRGNLTLLALGEFVSKALRFFAHGKENDNGSGFGWWIPDVLSLGECKNFCEEA